MQFDSLTFNTDFDQRIPWIGEICNGDICNVFNSLGSKIMIYVGVDDDNCGNFEFWNALLEFGCFAVSMVGSYDTAVPQLFSLKIRSVRMLDTRGHCIGCALLPGMLTLEVGVICLSWSLTLPSGATTVVAPGRMIENFLPIPNAKSLPLYHMVLKLACVDIRKGPRDKLHLL
jgi:hypothetical protein